MKVNRIYAALFLLFLLSNLAAIALGEGYSLPLDSSPGPVPNPSGYLSETAYEDETISVRLESRKIGDSVYNIAWVKIAHPSQLRTALAGPYGAKKRAKPLAMAEAANAVVAINGDYFQYSSRGYTVRQGETFRKTAGTKQLDLLIIDEAGDFHIIKKSSKKELADFLKGEHTPVNAFTFGPALVKDGQVQTIYNSYGFSPQDRAPRVGIGQLGPLEYVLVMVDGRMDGYSRGITIKTLADFMGELNCQQAFNLDGGGSAAMVFAGKYFNRMDDKTARDISDIIYFASAVPETAWQDAGKQE